MTNEKNNQDEKLVNDPAGEPEEMTELTDEELKAAEGGVYKSDEGCSTGDEPGTFCRL